jgi:hypothetical protein
MSYQPSLRDVTQTQESEGYRPSLSDVSKSLLLAGDENINDQNINQTNENNSSDQSFINKLPRNIFAGLAEGGHGLLNAPHNIVNMVSPSAASHIPTQKNYDFAHLLNLPSTATLADKIIRGLAQYAPALAIPEADMAIAGRAAGIPVRMAANAGRQAAYGATQTENPMEGATSGAIGGATVPLVSKLVNALRPSNIFRGNLSPEELASNQEAAKGTETGLGRIIESPSLNRAYENILPHVLFSGAENTMGRNANNITHKGADILDMIGKNTDPGNYGIRMQEALKKAASQATQEKNQGYRALDKAADEAGMKVGREKLSSTAQDLLDEMKSSSELNAENDPKLISDLERYASNKEENTLKNTNIFRSKGLGKKANQAYVSGDTHASGVYSQLKDALSEDIKTAFEGSENPNLKDLYAQNQKDYAEKFAPFEDKDIVKFTKKGGDPDLLLPHFLKGGKNDRATLLTKLTSKLAPIDKHIPLLAHLSKAVDKEGNVDPIQLSSLYRQLGENQRKALIHEPYFDKELKNYSNLVGQNKKALNLMFNPDTGVKGQTTRVLDAILKITQVAGGTVGAGLPGFLATTLGSGILGHASTKALTSPTLRDKLINAMIANKKWHIPGLGGATSSAIAPEESK